MSLIIRYKYDDNMREDFLGFFNTHSIATNNNFWDNGKEKKLTGKILGQIVLKIIDELELNRAKCVSFGSDGASVLTSKEKGAIKFLKDSC